VVENKNVIASQVSSTTKKRFHFSPIMFMAGIIPLAAVLAFLFLGNKSFWLDEAFSFTIARMDWPHFWHVLSHYEANQGLYYFILHFWANIGQSEFAIRSLSVVFALCMVVMTYIVGKHLFGERVGIIAALLITVNTFFIAYAQEARAYMLALLLATISSYFFIKAIEKPGWKMWIAYILFSSLGVYAHIYMVLMLGAQFVSLVFMPRREIPWKSLLISAVGIALLTAPMANFILTRDIGQIGWMEKPQLWDMFRVFNLLSGQGGPALMAVYFIASVLSLISIARIYLKQRLTQNTWKYAFLFCWLILPILFAFIFSFIKPIFVPRYFIIFLTPFIFLAAIGLGSISRRWLTLSFLTVLVLLSAFSLKALYTNDPNEDYTRKHDWRSTTSHIVSSALPGDAIVFLHPAIQLPFEYYHERLKAPDNVPAVVHYLSVPKESLTLYYLPEGFSFGKAFPEPERSILDRLSGYDRVWLVLGHTFSSERQEQQSQALLSILQEKYNIAEETDYYYKIHVYLLTPKVN
jgi:uncharacterized membrane protein